MRQSASPPGNDSARSKRRFAGRSVCSGPLSRKTGGSRPPSCPHESIKKLLLNEHVNSCGGGPAIGDGTHAACYVGHCTNHSCTGENPGGELRDGDAGKDADEQLAGQSLFDPTLVENGTCTLWFAAVIFQGGKCVGQCTAEQMKYNGGDACVRTTARQRRTAAPPKHLLRR
jgi:hypothetical protein